MSTIKCPYCDDPIPDSKISFSTRCNELGEEWSLVEAECYCGEVLEASSWGEFENIEEAKECLYQAYNH